MKDLQILVATMKQTDLSLADKMNIKTNAIIANQHDSDSIVTKVADNGEIKMITTATRGVGLNRNIALLASDAEILLFADDDMVYYDGELCGVKKAFQDLPDADVIIFSVDLIKDGVVYEKRHQPIKRRKLYNSLKFGTYAIAVRKKSIIKANITFNQLFGGGCIYSSGEDSLFIIECFKKGLKVYTHSYILGACAKDSSSWFVGFNEKYFFDKGAFCKFAFPKMYLLFIVSLAIKMKIKKKTELSLANMILAMFSGAIVSKKLISYKEFVQNNGK